MGNGREAKGREDTLASRCGSGNGQGVLSLTSDAADKLPAIGQSAVTRTGG